MNNNNRISICISFVLLHVKTFICWQKFGLFPLLDVKGQINHTGQKIYIEIQHAASDMTRGRSMNICHDENYVFIIIIDTVQSQQTKRLRCFESDSCWFITGNSMTFSVGNKLVFINLFSLIDKIPFNLQSVFLLMQWLMMVITWVEHKPYCIGSNWTVSTRTTVMVGVFITT